MPVENRWALRYWVYPDIRTEIKKDDATLSAKLLDISLGGAYIADVNKCELVDGASVTFTIPDKNGRNKRQINRPFTILPGRSDTTGKGIACRFATPLSPSEIALLGTTPNTLRSLDLAIKDHETVNKELGVIRTCRGQLFVTSLSVIAAWIITAIGMGLTNHLHPSLWLTLGASFPSLVLAIGLLSLIEKANAINVRKGFCAAIDDYLRNGISPPSYLGWSHLSLIQSTCRSRAKSGLCPVSNGCGIDDVNDYREITKNHGLLGNVLDSFGAVAGIIYGPLFAFFSALLIGVSVMYLARPLILVIGICIAVLAGFLYFRILALRKGNRSVEAYYFKWKHMLRFCRPIDGQEFPSGAPGKPNRGSQNIDIDPGADGSQTDIREPGNTVPPKPAG